ncbi:hypothetical protein GCM10022223_17220 [Kineosporia mesophila]|uniref:Glycoside hydrolase 35 catalytic domain-containing protein n=1 Tax=Kineosporia mesophila TaxID=566012 RepID=A0ABP6ZCW2_9ACTN|nr:beta-galactosidase [Kineosporia mesophila]MCD5352039.1 beta-galactosidase [Kineosporia mesophila]
MPAHDLITRHQDWSDPVTRPAMADVDPHHRIGLSSRSLLRDGRPWIPVSGEIHYSRVPRERWRERLLLMRSGGIDVISTYLIWLHHEPRPGQARFDGNRDVAAFVSLCAELDLNVVLRLGPWVHGEVRNGGFPDWVQQEPVRHRTDDPAYLDLVRPWFARLGQELGHLCGPGSPVVGLQLENELYTEPGHLLTLKAMARESGLSAPLWTATAWGGADLPADEVFPLWAGYGDGFWVDAQDGWAPNFRAHFSFSHEWDDPGVGADVRDLQAGTAPSGEGPVAPDRFPPATCELGGGMATTYHRRIVPAAADIAAVANAKLGSGSMWQGYYMYAGGLNPSDIGPAQESHATGYPNDLPVTDYDFHAAIGAAGLPSPSHAALRRQHAFLAAFGERLATMPASLPDQQPAGLDDSTTLRWAVRSDGYSGFVFVNWHQPHIALPTCRAVRLRVETPEGSTAFGPLDVPPGTIARWPFNLDLGGVILRSATASALTVLDDGTLVLVAETGIDVDLSIDAEVEVSGAGERLEQGRWRVPAASGGTVHLAGPSARADVVIVASGDADRVWVVEGTPERQVLLSDHPLWEDRGVVHVLADRRPRLRAVTAEGLRPAELHPAAPALPARPVTWVPVAAARPDPLPLYGSFHERASAPTPETVEERGTLYRLMDVGEPADGTRRLLEVEWAGDVAHLCVDGQVVADRFWDGTGWVIDLDTIAGAQGDQVSLRILPLHPQAPVWLDVAAHDRRRAVPGSLESLDAVTLSVHTQWLPTRGRRP